MTNRPTTTTARSANFQASNALPPLLRMQHSALRRRTPPAVMRHRVEAAKSSAAPRPPVPSTAQTVTGLSEPFFCFFAANLPPPSSLLPTRRSNYRRHRHCHRAAGTAQQSVRQQPLPVPTVRTATTENDATSPIHREADAKCRRKKGGHRTETHPLFRDYPQLFRASPRAQSNAPRQRPRSVRPTATLRAKTPSALTFFAYRFASLAIPPYLCADTCPQNFAPSVVKWPWLGFFSSPCCRNWW